MLYSVLAAFHAFLHPKYAHPQARCQALDATNTTYYHLSLTWQKPLTGGTTFVPGQQPVCDKPSCARGVKLKLLVSSWASMVAHS